MLRLHVTLIVVVVALSLVSWGCDMAVVADGSGDGAAVNDNGGQDSTADNSNDNAAPAGNDNADDSGGDVVDTNPDGGVDPGTDGATDPGTDGTTDPGGDGTADGQDDQPTPSDAALSDFALTDVNANSSRYQEEVSPRDYLGEVSAWYFGHST